MIWFMWMDDSDRHLREDEYVHVWQDYANIAMVIMAWPTTMVATIVNALIAKVK